MADNLSTQSATPATIPATTKIATREVTYSGDASSHIAPAGLVVFAGSDDAKTATDVSDSAPLPVKLPNDIKLKYGTKTSLTLTSLASLANGSSWQSDAINFAGAIDAIFRFQLNGTASGTSVVNVYAYAALGDTTYTDGASGSVGSYSGSRLNAKFVGAITMNAATGVVSVLTLAQAFDGALPAKGGLILTNNSGAALASSGLTIEYQLQTLTGA